MFTAVDEDAGLAQTAASKSLQTNFSTVVEGQMRSLVGSPGELIEKVGLYSRAGVDMTELKFIYSDVPSLLNMMSLFAKEVMPSA
jgi:hypothetical protein